MYTYDVFVFLIMFMLNIDILLFCVFQELTILTFFFFFFLSRPSLPSSMSLAANGKLTRSLRIAIIDGSDLEHNAPLPEHPGLRVSAIAPASVQLFRDAGAWDEMKKRRVTPYNEMVVWDTWGPGKLHWKASDMQDRPLQAAVAGTPWFSTLPPLEMASPNDSQSSNSRHATTDENSHSGAVLGHLIENDVIQGSLLHTLSNMTNDRQNNIELIGSMQVEQLSIPCSLRKPAQQESDSESGSISEWETDSETTVCSASQADSSMRSRRSAMNMESLDKPVQIRLKDGRTMTASLVIGADGPNSIVKKAAGISSAGHMYNQFGVVASVRTQKPHSVAWQRFLPNGPLALLPCHDDYSSIVWTTTKAHAIRLMQDSTASHDIIDDLNAAFRADPEEFRPGGKRTILQQLIPQELRDMIPVLLPSSGGTNRLLPPKITELVERPKAFPLRYIHASSYVLPRVVLVGDAAHVVHPLAGQGVNLGLSDVTSLVNTLELALESGQDIGSISLLEDYERKQRLSNLAMMRGVDAIQKTFSLNEGVLPVLRNVGLALFNAMPSLKNAASKRAMGGE
jgi:ubiquinone biosynthesis UbiH/UbiF/VisC/COQ6 family hydroxylase